MPRTALVASAATAVASALLIHDATRPHAELDDVAFDLEGGLILIGSSITLLAVGLAGIGAEQVAAAKQPLPPLPVATEPPGTLSFAPPGSARAELQGRAAQVALELRVEARAGHCAAATALARRLDKLAPATLLAIVHSDDAVDACIEIRP